MKTFPLRRRHPIEWRPHLWVENPTVADFGDTFTAMNLLPIPWMEPVDISHAVAGLASEESRYVTGVTLPVDAGFLAKYN